MPQRSVATNYTFEQQRTEINLLAADFWSQKTTVDNAASTYLKHDGSNDFTGGTLAVPAAFTINSNSGAGTVTISGNLNVTGTTTTVNTTNLDVTDKNITIAKGNTSDATADGAGITIDSGTDITWNFVDAKDAWVSSIGVEATTTLKVGGVASLHTAQFSGTTFPSAGHGVEIGAPDGNTGQVIVYDRDNSAYKQLNLKGSSVQLYAGTTNALSGTFNSTGLAVVGNIEGGGAGIFKKSSNNYILVGSTNAGAATLILDGDSDGDGSGGDYAYIQHDTSGNLNIVATNPGDSSSMIFNTGDGGERLRILDNGKIFVGAYSAGDDFSDAGSFLNIKNDTYGGRIAFSNNTATAGVALMEQFAYWGNNKVAGIIATAGTDNTNKDDGLLSFYTRASGSGAAEALRITSAGNLEPGGTNGTLNLGGGSNRWNIIYGNTLSLSSYASVGSIVAADPGSAYYAWNNRIGSGLAVAGTTYLNGEVGIGISNPTKTGIQNNVKLLQIDGGDGAELILGNSVSGNVSVNHVGAIAFKNIDNSTGSAPHYCGIRSNCTDTSGNMNLKFYAGGGGGTGFETDDPDMLIDSVGKIAINETDPVFGQTNGASQIAQGNPKLGVLGSVGIANYSATTTDYSELAFYRRTKDEVQSDGSHRITSTSNMGRISWYGASNDTAFPNKAYTVECVANGADWWAGSARRGYISFKEGYNDDETMRLTSNREIDTGSKTITGGTSLDIQNFRVKGIWSGGGSIGKEIELMSGYDGSVKMVAIGYNLTDTTKGSTYGGDLVFHTQPLYSSPLALPPERMRITSKGYVLVNTDTDPDEYMMVIKPNLDDDTRPANGLRINIPNGVGGGVAATSCTLRIDNDNNWNNCTLQLGADIIVDQQLTAPTTALRTYNKNTYGALYGNHTTVEKNLASNSDATSYYSNIITTNSGGTAYHFHGQNGGSDRVKIYQGGDIQNSNQVYGQLSDVKLKENIVDASSQWDDIKAVRVRNFNFKESTGFDTHKQIGVVAQEIETVSPGLVKTEDDITVDESTGEGTVTGTTKRVSYSILYMKAIKALQEAITRIETLESEVAALKSA